MNLASLANPLGFLLLLVAVVVIVRLATLLSRLSERVSELERRLASSRETPPAAQPTPAAAPVAAAVQAKAPVQAASHDVSPEDFAIVAAAVATVLGASARVVRITQADGPGHSPAWSIEGRRSIYHSHNVRR